MKLCDNCGGRLGMVVRRKWSWRFCKLTCKTAFEHRRREEFRDKMRELIKLSGFFGSGIFHATEYAGTMSGKKFVLFALTVLGTVFGRFCDGAISGSGSLNTGVPVSRPGDCLWQ
jgi:hypothetical protein